MKAVFFLLAGACLISGLAASVIKFPLENETPDIQESENSFDVDSYLNIFFPDDKAAENLIVPFPTDDTWDDYTTSTIGWETTSSTPTWETSASTTTWEPSTSTTTWEPSTSTTTWKPSTSTTTWEPSTSTTPSGKPEWKNPQIYNNAVRSLGPFAGKLVNIVQNRQGAQKTVQENEIQYNLRSLKNN